MDTRYNSIEINDKVMDVFYCLLRGKHRVKDIQKELNQPQQTISAKLKFLLKNKVVRKKNKTYVINLKKVYKIVYKEIKKYLENQSKNCFEDTKKTISGGDPNFGFYTVPTDDFYIISSISKKKNIERIVKKIDEYFPKEYVYKIISVYSYFFKDEPKSFRKIIKFYFLGLLETNEEDLEMSKLLEIKKNLSDTIPTKEKFFFDLVNSR